MTMMMTGALDLVMLMWTSFNENFISCWLLVVGCCLLFVVCWLLVVVCWLLVIGCLSLEDSTISIQSTISKTTKLSLWNYLVNR